MDDIDLRDAADLHEVHKMMNSRGWEVLLVSIAADREKLIKIVSGAQTKGEARKHDIEYFQGSLAGFQRIIDIFDRLKIKYDDLVEIAKRGKDHANAA